MVTEGKHHISAVNSIAPVLMTRIAACWRNGQRYQLRDLDGTSITETEGRALCAERYKIDPATRAARRHTNTATQLKERTSRRKKRSTTDAPASGPSSTEATGHEAA